MNNTEHCSQIVERLKLLPDTIESTGSIELVVDVMRDAIKQATDELHYLAEKT